MKKIIAIADIHIGNRPSEILKKEINWFFKEVKKLTKKDDLSMIVVAGDVFDKKISFNSEDAKLAIQFMTKLNELTKKNIYIRIIRGTLSHDLEQLENFRKFEKKNKLFRIINKLESEKVMDNKILWVPEEYEKNYEEYSQPFIVGKKYNYIFGHGTFDFVAHSSVISESERPIKNAPVLKAKIWKDLADLLVFGHNHTKINYKNIHYTGSFSRSCFGEEEDKGFFIIEDKLKSIIDFKKNIYAPEFKSIDLKKIIKEDEPIEDIIEKIENLKKQYANIRITSLPEGLANVEIFSSYFKKDENVKLSILAELKPKKREDKFDFVFDKSLSIYKKIAKFINLKYDKKIKSKRIKRFFNEKKEE